MHATLARFSPNMGPGSTRSARFWPDAARGLSRSTQNWSGFAQTQPRSTKFCPSSAKLAMDLSNLRPVSDKVGPISPKFGPVSANFGHFRLNQLPKFDQRLPGFGQFRSGWTNFGSMRASSWPISAKVWRVRSRSASVDSARKCQRSKARAGARHVNPSSCEARRGEAPSVHGDLAHSAPKREGRTSGCPDIPTGCLARHHAVPADAWHAWLSLAPLAPAPDVGSGSGTRA